MNFNNIIVGNVGGLHVIASVLALISGSFVLWMQKGTQNHRKMGYFYTISMVLVLITAFSIYRLFGKWGVFHWTAIISTLTLIAGFVPIFVKRPVRNYIYLHFNFMYWSVMGLYAAFVSETLVRFPKIFINSGIPNRVFFNMVGLGTAFVMGFGVYFFIKFKAKWQVQFKVK